MKKYLTAAAAGILLISTPSYANNAQKINLVKKVYVSFDTISDYDAIGKYADSDLKKAIRLGGYPYPEEPGMSCTGADTRLQAQDWDRPRFSYSVDNQGLVVVSIKDPNMFNYKKEVKYKLSGSPGKYKISDVIYKGSSFKQDLKRCAAGL